MSQALWRIGDPDGPPAEFGWSPFYDPEPTAAVFNVGTDELSCWPSTQPGPLDRDAGYRSHTAIVVFSLDAVPAHGADLELAVEAVSGPLPQLVADLNGRPGSIWLDAQHDLDPRVHFRTVVGGWMRLTVAIPAGCFAIGENRLSLTTVCLDEVNEAELLLPFSGTMSGFGSVLRWGGLALVPRSEPLEPPCLLLRPTPLFREHPDGGLEELVDVLITGPVDAGRLRLELEDQRITLETEELAFGTRRVRLAIREVAGERPCSLSLQASEQTLALDTTLRTCRKWTLHLMPHVHLDVGFTDYQGKVIELHSRNLERVLRLRERNPDYAFWVDGSFIVARYLESRSAPAREELIAAIRSGHVGVNALWFLFLTGVASLEECYRAGYYAEHLRRTLGVRLDTANLTDVPSYSAAVPSFLRAMGITRFLGIANHTRASAPSTDALHALSPFRWVGPDGAEVTTFLARHYSQLRYLAADPPTVAGCADGFSRYCQLYERDDYLPSDLPVVGINNDNEDLGHGEVDVVGRWSRAFAWPRLRFSTAADYFDALKEVESELPVVHGDGGSYWEDGVGAHAGTVALYREAQSMLPSVEGLSALLALARPDLAPPIEALDRAWDQLLIGCEHTWTSAHAVTHPHSHQTVDQLDWKVQQVRGAHRAAVDERRRALSQLGDLVATDGPSLLVYNPLPWTRSGAVDLSSDSRVRQLQTIHDVPGLGYRVVPLTDLQADENAPQPLSDGEHVLGQYVVTTARGRVNGLRHVPSGRDLVDSASPYGLGEVVYVSGGGTEEGLGLGAEATSLHGVEWHLPTPDLEVTGLTIDGQTELRCAAGSWSLTSSFAGPSLTGTVTLRGSDDSDCVTVDVDLSKETVRAKESVYVAFPFLLDRPRLRYDRQQGWVDPTSDHQPGACHEWLTPQSAVLLDGTDGSIAWATAHAPLLCCDDVVRGRWADQAEVRTGTLLSWVMNNYWFTNYPGSQSGQVRLSYAFSPVAPGDLAAAGRLARELRQPLLVQEVNGMDKMTPGGVLPAVGTLFGLSLPPSITATMVAARWSEGLVVRLQELAGISESVTVPVPPAVRIVSVVDAREMVLADLVPAGGMVTVTVGPHAVVSLLLLR